jgi:uncharacterized RmlC-like cupin family protein
MPTINPTPEQMAARIVRAKTIQPFKIGMEKLHGIPPEALEAISAKTIYLYMNPPRGDWTDKLAGVSGSPGLQVSVCHCPPGQGPELHAHERTVENFFCLKGEFNIIWGDDGQFSTKLNEHDMISMPPKVMRRFTNTSADDAILLVLIQGPDSDLSTDVQYAPSLGASLASKYGPQVRTEIENMGWRFDAELGSRAKADA